VKALLPARRAIKALDQVALGETPNGYYIPIETLSSWASHMSTPDAAVNVATVLTCVRVLAESFASVPLLMYRRLPDGGRERAIDHPLYPVLHQQPNPDMTSFVWRELVMSHLATWGNAYNEKAYDGLGRLQLWPIRPDRMTPRYGPNGTKEFEYIGTNGVRRIIPAERIFHLQGLGSTGLAGYSPIALLRSSLSLLRTAETFGQTIFDNNARPATVLQHPKTMSQGAIDRLTSQMDDLKGSRNNGKTVLLEEGTTVQPIGFPPEDAQFLETRVFQKREILAAYRIPPHMAGDLERATFSNIEQQSIEFRTYTMLPWYVRAEQDISSQLLDEDERDTFYAEFLADGLLRADAKSRAEALAVRWQNGTLNATTAGPRDEWRALENENPLPNGVGQTYYVPANYLPAAAPRPAAPPAPLAAVPSPEVAA
jgi:HK97 family phage portal protein